MMAVGLLDGKAQISPALKSFEALEKQARFAQASALTSVARIAQGALKQEAQAVFDRPTRYTLNSTYIKAATPGRLVAEVGFRGHTASHPHYLAAEVLGGARTVKRFEFWLRKYGVLGQNEYVVPANGFPLDVYGNMPRSVYAGILADLQAHPDEFSRSTPESRAKRGRRRQIAKRAIYFATKPGSRLPLGIYQRVRTAFGSTVRGVFMFVRLPRYRVRLPLLATVTRIYDQHIVREMDEALARALATAR